MLPTYQNCKYCHTANSNLPKLQILQNCKLLNIFFTASWPQGAGGYIYIYVYIYITTKTNKNIAILPGNRLNIITISAGPLRGHQAGRNAFAICNIAVCAALASCYLQYGSMCNFGKLVALQLQLCSLQLACCCIAVLLLTACNSVVCC